MLKRKNSYIEDAKPGKTIEQQLKQMDKQVLRDLEKSNAQPDRSQRRK